ncbi:hypothetical protein H2200_012524 [Cladophialophora chaetospira]|uniref:Uncharacterized protein n=1 Tax=Cladophialophora chaetospira TaxID=386627 RepID=A0AA39CCH2_9EURO|nr:hypothetical protein H2200_012524 [Cladophialophora chaetospira]
MADRENTRDLSSDDSSQGRRRSSPERRYDTSRERPASARRGPGNEDTAFLPSRADYERALQELADRLRDVDPVPQTAIQALYLRNVRGNVDEAEALYRRNRLRIAEQNERRRRRREIDGSDYEDSEFSSDSESSSSSEQEEEDENEVASGNPPGSQDADLDARDAEGIRPQRGGEIHYFPQPFDIHALDSSDPHRQVFELANALITELDPQGTQDTRIPMRRTYLRFVWLQIHERSYPILLQKLGAEAAGQVIVISLRAWTKYTCHLELLFCFIWNWLLSNIDQLESKLGESLSASTTTDPEQPFDAVAWYRSWISGILIETHYQYTQQTSPVPSVEPARALWETELSEIRAIVGDEEEDPEIVCLLDAPFESQPTWELYPQGAVYPQLPRWPTPPSSDIPYLEIIEASGFDFDTYEAMNEGFSPAQEKPTHEEETEGAANSEFEDVGDSSVEKFDNRDVDSHCSQADDDQIDVEE